MVNRVQRIGPNVFFSFETRISLLIQMGAFLAHHLHGYTRPVICPGGRERHPPTGEIISESRKTGRVSLCLSTCMLAVCRSSPSQKILPAACVWRPVAGAVRALAAALVLGAFLVLDEGVDRLARRAPDEDEEMCCLFALRARSSSFMSSSESESTVIAVVSR